MLSAQHSSHAQRLIDEGYSFYLASNARVLDVVETSPGGLPVTALDFLAKSPDSLDVGDLMRIYNRLNGVAFGPTELGMPMWVMIDLGLLPSAFLLITLPLDLLVQRLATAVAGTPQQRRDALERIAPLIAEADARGYEGPIPVAGYCAAPSAKPGHWIGWSVCSAITGAGLASLAKAIGLDVYRAVTLLGVTQFNKSATRIHRKFGRMRIVAATLPLHTVAHTYVYETEIGVADGRDVSFHMLATDLARQQEMQANIIAGTHDYYVLSPGLESGQVPIHEVVR